LLALAGLGATAPLSAFAELGGMTVDSKGGLEVFQLNDDNYWFTLGGRLFLDQVFFDGDDNDTSGFPSGSHIRRARVTLKGGVGDNWVYKMDLDFSDLPGVPARTSFGEAFLGYTGCPNLWFAIGQISVPMGLENWQSANDLPFMEMSLASQAFSPDQALGLYAEWHGQMFTAAGAIFHPGSGTNQGLYSSSSVGFAQIVNTTGIPGSDPLGAGARITFSPVHNDFTVYHAGISTRYVDLHDTQNNFNFISGMELQARQTPVLFTGIPFNSSNHYDVWGFELAGRWGSFVAQGEYIFANVDRPNFFAVTDPRFPGGDLDYHGFYVMASYVLTGEIKEYDFNTGTFGWVHPQSRKGAWEVLARYDYVNLLDGSIIPSDTSNFSGDVARPVIDTLNDMTGGAHGVTVGLNWYVNERVRFMANYVRMDLPIDIDLNVFGFRAQVSW